MLWSSAVDWAWTVHSAGHHGVCSCEKYNAVLCGIIVEVWVAVGGSPKLGRRSV